MTKNPVRFTVKLGNEVVGFSDIAEGDPHMGCAYGKLVTTPSYKNIQEQCIKNREEWKPITNLFVEVNGSTVECAGGFQIVDFSPEYGSEGIELHMAGITSPRYSELFPDDFEKQSR